MDSTTVATSVPQVAPAPVAAPTAAPSPAPAPVSDVQAYVDSLFDKGDRADTQVGQPAAVVSPAGQAAVSPEQQVLTQPQPHVPVTAPQVASPQAVNGQQAQQAQPENPLPAGVRQRLAEEAERRRAAEERAVNTERQLAEMRGYLMALQQQGAQQQQAEPPPPDHIADPQGYAAWVQEKAARVARSAVEEATQPLKTELANARQIAARATWQTDRMRAVSQYGEAAVSQVEQMMRTDARLGNAYSFDQSGRPLPNPYTRAVADMKLQQLRHAIPNGDVEAFKAQAIREAMQNPQVLAQYAAQRGQVMQQQLPQAIPPSLADQPRNGGFATMPADPMDDLRQMDRERKARLYARSAQPRSMSVF